MDNVSEIPAILNTKTTKTLSLIPVTRTHIAKIIKRPDPNITQGHDMISMRMLKLCGSSVLPPLEFIFNSCLESGIFLSKWKKANVVLVHKKGDKQSLKNYCPISLLLSCRKIFERLICNKIFEYFIECDLISHNQSAFKR